MVPNGHFGVSPQKGINEDKRLDGLAREGIRYFGAWGMYQDTNISVYWYLGNQYIGILAAVQ